MNLIESFINNPVKVTVGVLLVALHRHAGLGRRERVNLWVRPHHATWDPDAAFDAGNLNLILLMGIRLMRTWNADLHLITTVRDEADVRGLRIYDATCPLVTKVHVEVAKMRQDGVDIVMIGHKGHPEVEGTMGQVERGMHLVESVEDVQKLELADPERIALVTQTTLSVDDAAEIIAALKAKYPKIREPKKQDICYATQNRQDAVKFMAPQCDVVIVVGSPNSSNSSRLREVAEKRGVDAYMVDAPDQIDPAWVAGKRRIGVTAGASAPEVLAQAVIARLRELGVRNVRALDGIEENVSFPLPRGLNLPPAA